MDNEKGEKQDARQLVLAGTFTADGNSACAEGSRLQIVAEVRTSKFVEAVEQITFNGPLAAAKGQPVLYVTERCVFKLQPKGLQLIGVVPALTSNVTFSPIWRFDRLSVTWR